MFKDVDPFEPAEERPEFHAVYTIQLAELVYNGLDFSDKSFDFDSYNKKQRDRLYQKLYARFAYAEIGILPPSRWQERLIGKLNEIMPKYKPLYKALDDGYSPMQDGSERGKSRDIDSEFPQTMLGDNQDYASRGHDREFEIIRDGKIIDIADDLQRRYNDVDVMILNELESLFVALTTANLNGY